MPPSPTPQRSAVLVTLTVLLTAAILRGPLVAIAPVADVVGPALGVGPGFVGLLTSIPVFCFAVLAPMAITLVRRTGSSFALTVCIVGTVVGCGLRSAGGPPTVITGTVLLGVCIAIANIVLPVVVGREYPPRYRNLMTGIYAATINAGTMAVTLTTVPLSDALGWRWAISAWAVLGIAAVGLWLRARGLRTALVPVPAGGAEAGQSVVPRARTPVAAWLLTAAFAGQSFSYYGITAWLPSILGDRGYPAAQAGAISAIFQGAGIVGALMVPLIIRLGGSRVGAVVVGVGWLSLPIGFLVAPRLWLIWCTVGGLAQAGGFAVVLIVLNSLRGDERSTAAWTGLVQGTGYAVAAAAPFTLGALHEATGDWVMPLLVIVGSTLVYAVSATLATTRAPGPDGTGSNSVIFEHDERDVLPAQMRARGSVQRGTR